MKHALCKLIALSAAVHCGIALASPKANKSTITPQVLSGKQIADMLNWLPSKDSDNICGGSYKEPKLIVDNPTPTGVEDNATAVTADGPALFSSSGRSILQQNVVVTQPGRLINADKAYIYRNADNGKISAIELFGHVRFQQKDKLIVSQHAYLDLSDGSSVLDDGLYHVLYNGGKHNDLSAWGRAYQVKRRANGVIDLYGRASYTTCPPIKPSWMIHANRMHLDKHKGVGKAYGVVLKFHKIPLLYTPYFSFAIDKQRKSGLLTPIIGHTGPSGLDIALPIYWNMAPNYDMTITPRMLTKRGFQLNGQFRFLSNTTRGRYFGNFLPGDKAFRTFKQETLDTTAATAENLPYLNAIEGYTNNRWMVTINQHSAFGQGWTADFNVNRVSDSYYLKDFDITANGATANQLLNQADLHYRGQHWEFTGMFQGYQTLHPINQPITDDQYQRIPEIDSTANYPGLTNWLDFNMSTSLINFGYNSFFVPNLPVGQRIHLRPSVSIPMNWAAGYVTPSLYVDNTDYVVEHQLPYQDRNIARTLPIVDIDTGLYLDRPVHFGSHHLIETFEPQVFYLYVPYKNQSNIPNFDTYSLPFSFAQVFSLNRFTGYDRIQNANQFSLGFTSRFLNAYDGSQRFRFDVGTIYYMAEPKVCLNRDCAHTTNNFSPIVSDVTFNPANHWSTTATWAWDPNAKQTNNAGVTFNYIRDNSHLFSLQYNYVRETDGSVDIPSRQTHSNLIGGTYFPLTSHWNGIAYAYYNLTDKHPESYYFGVEYNTCCWSLRFLTDRLWQNNIPAPGTGNTYQTGYYVQLSLKGLGALANKNTDRLFMNTLPGYNPDLR
ncbi:MAG: LPS assembly protein LptD [Coxiellaceae bacterium]|nr:LPS assembly protein LptD [Coxiellaceae bacterium]